MPLMEWNKTLLLDVEPFDKHHEHLFSLLNRIYDLISSNAPSSEFNDVLVQLRDYTVYHFNAEEVWMQEQNYPMMLTHLQQHKLFLNEVIRFQEELAAGSPMVAIGILTFLKEWLLNHIYKIDTEYAAHLRSKA